MCFITLSDLWVQRIMAWAVMFVHWGRVCHEESDIGQALGQLLFTPQSLLKANVGTSRLVLPPPPFTGEQTEVPRNDVNYTRMLEMGSTEQRLAYRLL